MGSMTVNKGILKFPKQNSPKLDSSYKVKGLNKQIQRILHAMEYIPILTHASTKPVENVCNPNTWETGKER